FDGVGYACAKGNSFRNSGASSITQTDCAWWTSNTLPYAYTLTDTAQLVSILTSRTGTCDLMTVTSIDRGALEEHAFSIVPNPSKEAFMLNAEAPVSVVVLDARGTVVEQRAAAASHNFGAQYKAGIYFVKVTKGAEVKTLQMIKE
ncbi:MAG TPA: T9SS type A sorting domain-containing protein, partial [Cytophagales bacterium]|nr:T9SS type A sorting domain-containing protein [Cytophagales bacterium]